MSIRKPSPRKPPKPKPKRAPWPNNPFGIENEEWIRLGLEAQQYERKWIAWSPGHDKILASSDALQDVIDEVRRQGHDEHEVSYEHVEPLQAPGRPPYRE
jgi:hypothetical protein